MQLQSHRLQMFQALSSARAIALFVALCSLALCSLAVPAAATEPWMVKAFELDPATLLEAADAIAAPADSHVHVLFSDSEHNFDGEGRDTSRTLLIYRLLSREGVDSWSTVGATWAPWYQETPQIRARVITPSGQERRLDPATLSEAPVSESSTDIFDDRRILQAPLPALEVGSLVIEEVILKDRQPLFAAGTHQREYLVSNQPIYRGRLILQAPTTLALRYGMRLADHVALVRSVSELDGDAMARLEFTYVDAPAAIDPPPNLPFHQARFPSIVFSTGESWKAIAQAYSEIVEDKIRGAQLTEVLVGFPVAGTRQDKIDFLLAQVQKKVRYTGLELGAASIIPVTPAEILQRQFGDCKDQATLLVALLRQVDIDANVALLRADFGADLEPNLPGLGFFNHAIVYIPGERPQWIDPTDPHARAGELPLADQGRWALVADAETEQLIPTPTSSSIDNRVVETRQFFLSDYGNARVVETSEYYGSLERRQRSARAGSTDHLKENYLNYVKQEYLATELVDSQETVFDDLSQPFTLELVASGAKRGTTDLTEAAVALTYGNLFDEIPEPLMGEGEAARQDDFLFLNPFVKEWHFRIHLPPGLVPRELPADKSQKLGNMLYEERYTYEAGLLSADLRLDSGLRRLTPEQFEATRQGLEALGQSDITVLNFDHLGGAHLAAGRSRQAIEAYRQLVEAHPDKAIHRVRYAQALLGLGMGREARRQAQLATQAEPELAIAHWIHGFSLAHDEVGRVHHAGFDHAAALAALSKAHALDPSNALFHAEMAILLDFNDQGVRYGLGADLDRAVVEYRSWKEAFERDSLNENLLNALFWRDRWQDLVDFTDELANDAKGKQVWLLTGVGALNGSQKVLGAAAKLGLDQKQQAEMLAVVAQNLILAGHFRTAGEILRHTASAADNPAAAHLRADLLIDIGPDDGITLSDDDPATAIKQLIRQVLAPQTDPAALRGLFHPDLVNLREMPDDELEAMVEASRRVLRNAGGLIQDDDLATLMLQVLNFETEGDATHGVRIEVESPLPGVEYAGTGYVKPDAGSFRIIALEQDLSGLALEALRDIEAGDLDGARQWLDWARETFQLVGSEDPLNGNIFARAWKKGQTAEADDIRFAASLLLAQFEDGDGSAAPTLRQMLAQRQDPTEQQLLHLGLLVIAVTDEDSAAFKEHAAWLFESYPTSELALASRVNSLRLNRDAEELMALAKARLEDDPQDPTALEILAIQHLNDGELDKAFARFAAVDYSDEGQRANAINTWAWSMLFDEPVSDEALKLAQKSADLVEYRSYAILHTLAMAYAELDRPLEGYRVLMQAIGLRLDSELEDADRLVVGRIAQSYGLNDVARHYYGGLQEPDTDLDPMSSWHLAQRHLEQMGGVSKKGKRGKKKGL